MPALFIDPVEVEFGPPLVLYMRGRVVLFDPVVVRASQNMASAFLTRQLRPAGGVVLDAWVQTWVSAGGDVKEAMGMSVVTVSAFEGERPTLLARLLRANGLYPLAADIEQIEVSVYHEDAGLDDEGPVFTDNLHVEEVFFDELQRDGYATSVPGGYNFRWQVPANVAMLGGNVYRIEVTAIYAEDQIRSSRVYRVAVLPLQSFDW